MSLSSLLANRFREVMLQGKWVANTNFKDQLEKISLEKASKKVASLNSIEILSQHIHYYIAGVNKVLKGGALEIRDVYSFDFIPMETQQQWEAFLATFWKDAEEFANLVEKLNENQLKAPFVDEKYGSYLRNIEGMIEHCYYHLGQIVLLNKLHSENNSY